MAVPSQATEVVTASVAPVAFLLEFVFDSETMRVWTGYGRFKSTDDRLWDGVGKLARIEGLSQGLSTSAPAGKVIASGVDADTWNAAVNATEYLDRPLNIYLQPFLNRAAYGAPVPIALRIMKNMEISRDAGTRTIAVTHEGPYTGRRRPVAGWYSDRDQQRRFTGDQFCERTQFLLFQQERWPHYTP